MKFRKIKWPLSGLLLLGGLALYIWPLVANAGAPYDANSPMSALGLGMLLVGLSLVRR